MNGEEIKLLELLSFLPFYQTDMIGQLFLRNLFHINIMKQYRINANDLYIKIQISY
jgi:hypothetical protein